MQNDKLNEAEKLKIIRIHRYGILQFEEDQADKYFFSFFEQLEKIAEQPFRFHAVDHVREGYKPCVIGVDKSINMFRTML